MARFREIILLWSLILIPAPVLILDGEVDIVAGVGVETRRIGFLGAGAVRAVRTSCKNEGFNFE